MMFNLPPLSIVFYSFRGKKRLQIKVTFYKGSLIWLFKSFFQRNLIFSIFIYISIQDLKFYTNIFQKFCHGYFFNEDCSINYFVLLHFLKKTWFYILLSRGNGIPRTNVSSFWQLKSRMTEKSSEFLQHLFS